MKALDLFCGLGGWSDGLSLEGFKVLGVEINPKIAELYTHAVLIEDVINLDGRIFRDFDLIVGSPPCRDFSIIAKTLGHTWNKPPQPKKEGLKLINAFLRIIREAKPHFWLMENVPGLIPYLELKPKVKTHLGRGMLRCFWGDFPAFLISRDMTKSITSSKKRLDWNGPSKFKSWARAKIPLSISRALGKSVREALNDKSNV